MIQVDCLFSGSDGNSYLIRSNNTSILIDCGGSCRAIEKRLFQLGSSLNNISDIFITHEHTDHTSASEIIAKNHQITFHMTEISSDHLRGIYIHQHLETHPTVYSVVVGDLKVSSFKLPHDSYENVGYIITSNDDKIGIATDMGTNKAAKKHLIGCRLVVIESNHDINMLKYGPYPYDLKKRIASSHGHLSNDDCAELALELAKNGTTDFMLAHISRENNEYTLPKQVVLDTLKANNYTNINVTECSSRKGFDV